jgi:tRNA A37 N6-isopentenylltransferase MiaA
MSSQIQELKEWIESEQSTFPEENMTDQEVVIYATLQLVKRQIEYIVEQDKEKCKDITSPGHYGC